jgi:hypothetical protein
MAIVEQEHRDRAERLLSDLEAWRPDIISVAPGQSAAADIAAVAQALADAESASDNAGWLTVAERPLEDGEARIMAVQILRNGVPDWDIFIATPECGEWSDESNDPGWGVDEVTHSCSLDLAGLPPLPPASDAKGRE